MRTRVILALAACLALFIVRGAQAAVTVVAPGSTVAGKTIGQWTEAWWNWAESLSPGPFSDTTGTTAALNQSGPVFFVAGTTGGPAVSRSFVVPDNTYVLLPLVNWLVVNGPDAPFPDTKTEAIALATNTINPANLIATIDGNVIPNLGTHREASPSLFSLTAVNGNDSGIAPGTFTDAYSDGYWLMLAPLSDGPHTLHFGGVTTAYTNGPLVVPSFSIDVTDTITVVPASSVPLPAGVWPGGALLLAMAAIGLRGRKSYLAVLGEKR